MNCYEIYDINGVTLGCMFGYDAEGAVKTWNRLNCHKLDYAVSALPI